MAKPPTNLSSLLSNVNKQPKPQQAQRFEKPTSVRATGAKTFKQPLRKPTNKGK
ncbi:MAG: hypothetical protein ACFCVE_11355 [Phycisphaerae bacterium]